VKNNDGDDAYLLAAYNGKQEIMEYLEAKGFNIHVKSNNGNDAYLVAAYNGKQEIMEYLEAKGFNIHVKNNNGDGAYSLAVKNGKTNVISYLKNKIIINEKIKNVKVIQLEESESEINTCTFCHVYKKDFICIPCGHLYMCGKCANNSDFSNCCICGQCVSSIHKVFC
jgi:ankyrin repeat protein